MCNEMYNKDAIVIHLLAQVFQNWINSFVEQGYDRRSEMASSFISGLEQRDLCESSKNNQQDQEIAHPYKPRDFLT